MEEGRECQHVVDEVIASPGVTLIIGAVDTGKSTLAAYLASEAVRAGLSVAVVDADPGQSEVGPPAAVSMAVVEQPVPSLRELEPRRMYFVGATSPVGHMVPLLIGTKRMTDEALSRGIRLVIVDTAGLATGAVGRRLKLSESELIAPQHIVALARRRELDPVLAMLSRSDRFVLHRVSASPDARVKPVEFRTARRRAQFYEYFKNARRHIVRLDDVSCWGTLLNSGRAVPWRNYKTIERAIGARVLHAEVSGNAAYIVSDCQPDTAGVRGLMERYGAREYTVVCGTSYSNVLVALGDERGDVMELGILEAIDFTKRHLSVVTPARTVTPVRNVQFGSIRVRADGAELGRIRPGEI